MTESSLQHWLQWRLLQPIENNLAESDLRRWQQWWHEPDGQAFWRTCEWLWHMFGQGAINDLLLHIETALAESDLHRWVQQWQKGDHEALWQLWQELWGKYSPSFIRAWYGIAQREPYDLVANAFSAAFEELDLKVSGGRLLTRPADGIDWDKRKDIPETVIALQTGRELGMRKPFEWRGPASFAALFRKIWEYRCSDAFQHETPHHTVIEEAYNQLTGKLEPVKIRVPIPHDPIDPTREGDSEDQGGTSQDDIPSDQPGGESLTLDGDTLGALVEAFAQVAAQLDFAGKPGLAAVPEKLILYVKRKVAETNLASLGFSETRLQDQPFLTQLLSIVQGRDIEDLLDLTNTQHLDFDSEEAWGFVQSTLNLKREALYKRRQLFLDTLPTLPQVPEILLATVGRLWLREMRKLVEDCRKTAERCRQQGDANKADLLDLIEDYLRWTFAQSYPKKYRNRSLDRVENVPAEELFKVNDPEQLAPSYPNAEDFRRFVSEHHPDKHGLLAALPSLQEAIDKLGQPRPIRLVKPIEALLHKQGSDDKEPADK